MKVKLNNVRLAFPVLFEAKTVNGEGKPAFSASFLIDPADPQVKALNQAIEQVAKATQLPNDDVLLNRSMRLMRLSEYKRRQAAPGIKITARSFDKDWRMPITNGWKG